MTELLTAAQMRAIEQAAIASGEVTGLELMERAGRGVVEAILEWRPELARTSHRAVVLCGPGNNGGDGFVVARLLKQRGWEVEVLLYGDEAKLPPDAAENARRWREMGEICLIDPNELPALKADTGGNDLIIDALFGIGFSRPIDAALKAFLTEISSRAPYSFMSWVAVDLPTGLCSDSGLHVENDGDFSFVKPANLTVTFHRPKLGHYMSVGPRRCGRLISRDIGLAEIGRRTLYAEISSGLRILGELHQADNKIFPDDEEKPDKDLVGQFEQNFDQVFSPISQLTMFDDQKAFVVDGVPDETGKFEAEHKYDHGHALVLSGGSGKGGAARLAARGALRIGAGLATVGCPPEALTENAARLDAVMLAPVGGVQELASEMAARKVNAVCIGPGFGLGERLRDFIEAVISGGPGAHPTPDREVSVVLDADALTEYRDDPEMLFAMLHDRCVLTPHEGEFGRLFPDIRAKLKEPATKGPAYSKVDATREAAKRAGCVVLFKGPDTVIADPDGRCAINAAHYERAAPWLATAGSGDVLAGFITGLLARGFDPMSAAETAAWLHVECALKFGPGLIAEDLPEQLPAVFRDLGL